MFFLAALMAVVVLLNVLGMKRYTYTEKYHHPDNLAPDLSAGNFDELVWLHDIIIEGTILAEASTGTLIHESGSNISLEYYKVAVKNIWYGECPSMVITLWVQCLPSNGLHKNDRIIFAARAANVFPQNGETAYLADDCSICVLNPPDHTTYFLSDVYPSEYDGLTVSAFQNELQAALDNIAVYGSPINTSPRPKMGKIAAPYYEKYLEDHPKNQK